MLKLNSEAIECGISVLNTQSQTELCIESWTMAEYHEGIVVAY